MRAAWPLFLAVLLAVPLAFAENLVHNPATGVPDNEIIVAVIDTGIDPTHPEFAPGQIVAWWDFSVAPVPDGIMHSAPKKDLIGHGTGTASLVGGATVGAYPGVKLAIAKVTADGSSGFVNTDAAIRWAAGTVGADVISLSYGPGVPLPGAAFADDEAVQEATRLGALVVASAGNGFNVVTSTGVKFPGELHPPSATPSAMMVGAVGYNGRWTHTDTLLFSTYSNTDPDIVAWGTFTCLAKATGTTMASTDSTCQSSHQKYGVASGTSFSTPLVAGWAAKVMKAAMDAGQDSSPARIKGLFLGTAFDDVAIPYVLEGRGYVNGFTAANYAACTNFCNWATAPNTVAAATALAISGGAPPGPAAEAATSELAATTLRQLAMNTADGSLVWLGSPHGSNGQKRLNASALAIRDAEVWTIPLARGDRISIWVNASDAASVASNNADMFLFSPADAPTGDPPMYDLERATGASERTADGGQTRESINTLVAETGTYTFVVQAAVAKQNGMTYSLSVSVNGALVAPTYVGDETHFFGPAVV